MEVNNPLRELVKITENRWYIVDDFAAIVGLQFKLQGLGWRTEADLVSILSVLVKVGFLEVGINQQLIKICDCWYANVH